MTIFHLNKITSHWCDVRCSSKSQFFQFRRKFLMCWKVELFVRHCSAVFKWGSYFYNTAKVSVVPAYILGIFQRKVRIKSSFSAKKFYLKCVLITSCKFLPDSHLKFRSRTQINFWNFRNTHLTPHQASLWWIFGAELEIILDLFHYRFLNHLSYYPLI